MSLRLAPLAVLLVCPLSLWTSPACGAEGEEEKPLTYDDHVLPILRAKCVGCHNADKQEGGLNMSQFAALMQGGGSGEVVSPGDGEYSYLYMLAAHEAEPVMPPNGAKMADADLATLKKWIDTGARENAGSKVKMKPKEDLSLGAAPIGRPDGPPPMPPNPYDAASYDADPKPLSVEAIPVEGRVGDRADAVVAMAASQWAPLIAIGGDGQVLLFHADSLQPWGVLPFPEGRPQSLKFSTNGRLLIAGGGRGAYRGLAVVWDVTTGARVMEIGEEPDAVLAADISPDQSLVAIGTTSKKVKVYAVASGEMVYMIEKPTDWATAVAFSPDGVLLAIGDRGGNLSMWEAASGLLYADLRGHRDAITGLSWRADSNLLASSSLDDTVHLWNPEDGALVRKVDLRVSGAESVAFAADGTFAVAGRNGGSSTWGIDGKQLKDFPKRPDFALSVACADEAVAAADGKRSPRVFVGDWTGQVAAFDPATGELAAEFSPVPPPMPERIAAAETKLKELTAAAEGVAKRRADAAAAVQQAQEAKKATAERVAAVAKEKEAAEKSRKELAEAASKAKQATSKAEQAAKQAAEAAKKSAEAAKVAEANAAEATKAVESARSQQTEAAKEAADAVETAEGQAAEATKAAESAEGDAADAAKQAAEAAQKELAEAKKAAEDAKKAADEALKAAEQAAAKAMEESAKAVEASQQAAKEAQIAKDAQNAAEAESKRIAAELAVAEAAVKQLPKDLDAAKKAAEAAEKAIGPAEEKKKEADALPDPAAERDAVAARLAGLKLAAERLKPADES
ncbi:c-type cytochrome domain-containing protein [Alienimonas chondri]|uniref:Cytochrome c domain-containing protein n=1 Tax=Alienimonas chondri TaxID=2681879 RepID=A0ABX1VBE4_9PLAN|nr:c-type cytochrome domain-containing protein [Alienimonas chondri]NNJ25098.1 hypothetical protein [Alienimonas chondri]